MSDRKPAFSPIPVHAWRAETRPPGMTQTHLLALIAIADHDGMSAYHPTKGSKPKAGCYASSATIAAEIGMNASNVRSALADLERWGLIRRTGAIRNSPIYVVVYRSRDALAGPDLLPLGSKYGGGEPLPTGSGSDPDLLPNPPRPVARPVAHRSAKPLTDKASSETTYRTDPLEQTHEHTFRASAPSPSAAGARASLLDTASDGEFCRKIEEAVKTKRGLWHEIVKDPDPYIKRLDDIAVTNQEHHGVPIAGWAGRLRDWIGYDLADSS